MPLRAILDDAWRGRGGLAMSLVPDIVRERWSRALRPGTVHGSMVRGAGAAIAVRILGMFAALGVQVLLARRLSPTGYGEYAYAFAWVTLLSTLLKLGLDTATLRFGPVYLSQGKLGLLRGLLAQGERIALALAVVGMVVLGAAGWLLGSRVGISRAITISAAALLLPALTLERVYSAQLRAFKEVLTSRLPREIIFPVVLVLSIVAAGFFYPAPFTSLHAVGASVVASLAMLVSLGITLHAVVPAGVKQAVPEYHTRLWVSTTVQHTVLGVLGLIINEVDVLLVGSFVPPDQVGLYAAASRASKVIPFGLAAINFVVAPYISELYSQGKRRELQRILTLAAYGILFTAIPVAAVMLLFGGRVMAVFGPEFVVARPVLSILVLGQLVNAMCGSIGLLLIMTGHHKYNIMVVGTCAALDVLLCSVLAPRYGIVGGAIATSLTLGGWNIILSWTAWRVVGVDPTILSLVSRRRPHDGSA